MRTSFTTHRLAIALTAGAFLTLAASISAEEPYERVTVEQLKRIQKQNDEEQKRLEATPEYQAKKRQEEEARKRREQEAYLAKEREMKLKLQAAELRRKELENQRLADRNSTNYGGSGGWGTVVVVPNVYDVPRLAVIPHFPVVRHVPVVRPVVRIRR